MPLRQATHPVRDRPPQAELAKNSPQRADFIIHGTIRDVRGKAFPLVFGNVICVNVADQPLSKSFPEVRETLLVSLRALRSQPNLPSQPNMGSIGKERDPCAFGDPVVGLFRSALARLLVRGKKRPDLLRRSAYGAI
jgi:hypothetical protein